MDVNLGLHCNYKKCVVSLKSMAWITSCSHVFCDEHTPAFKDTKICPLCATNLNERYAIIKKNLNPTDTEKGMVLAGLNPTTILEIGSKAMAFLKFQTFQEKLFLTSLVKHLKRRLAQAESRLGTMSEKIELQTRQESQKYFNLQHELHKSIEKRKQLEQELETKNRQLHNCYQMLSQKSQIPSMSQLRSDDFSRSQSNFFRTNSYDYKANINHMEDDDEGLMFRSQQHPKRTNMKNIREFFHQK